ncbi:flagellar protein FliS [Peptoanaerobacter stomatis]|uniref:Flagellar protein FliS n=1 Tax=Peptoanaerobacter stomatis TaxID=796937 RepID=J6H9K3_9FIRM|nr:flagellar export chaperone FliS [Peptoanaerobacter stomatis]EJU19573.1 flagellar protein FliS [Peptoanaerobacter stomatis]NWO25359.1 flagellar export chaperone FliS [Peptostreptococcaceae bacterium oral taxon 081]
MLLNPYAKYKENSINTATKEELTLMLYDGCIKFMNLAKIGIEEKNIQKANDNLLKAQAIITELDVTLNMDIEISKNMHSLYDFALSRLVDANLKKDTSFIDDAKIVIVDLRDAWKEAMNIVKRGK